MTAAVSAVSPGVIETQKKLFCDWFSTKYMVSIHFDGDKIVTPPVGARSQGRSVSLCANVSWAAWQEARQSVVIHLPEPFEHEFTGASSYHQSDIEFAITEQGYRVEVKSE